jgi:hypothetical protein
LKPDGPRIGDIRELTPQGAHYVTGHGGVHVHAHADGLHGTRGMASDCDVCQRG